MSRQDLGMAVVLGFFFGIAFLYVIVGKWLTRRSLKQYQKERIARRNTDWTSY